MPLTVAFYLCGAGTINKELQLQLQLQLQIQLQNQRQAVCQSDRQ